MDVVVVESPAKAKTINKYLGSGYQVVASYGHVRDLPPKDGSVDPDNDFSMVWQVDAKAQKRLNELAKAVKGADRLILATDPDREGEAISWHVLQVLKEKKALKEQPVERVVFNAITKQAVLDAMAAPRAIEGHLVDAYRARRALDYLVGFNLSPVLWRKLPGARSAGRVQSVALRLVCDREAEIERFVQQEYWSVVATLLTPAGDAFDARVVVGLNGRRLDRLAIATQAEAQALVAHLMDAQFTVASVEAKPQKRNPSPPFTTSTLQQEASRKLGFSSARTMQVAQRLYEGIDLDGETVGLITYMRTDGVQMAPEGVAAIRRIIDARYGAPYLPDKPRHYATKAKNAQEAHEAIRPTDVFRTPADLRRHLGEDEARLYELVWKRAVSSQMASAEFERTVVDVDARRGDERIGLRATGSVMTFDGFLGVYQEGVDDAADEDDGRLPKIAAGDRLTREAVKPSQHFTEPPPRYTEATLIKRMEELGIGRPSTYTATLSTLRDREYVTLDKKRLIPGSKGRIVTAFLESFFERYVEYGFTADLEEKLDAISDGRLDWRAVLREFWNDFSAQIGEVMEVRTAAVLDALNEELAPLIFLPKPDGSDPRACPACASGRLSLKNGRYGAFIGCSNYPECSYTRQFGDDPNAEPAAAAGPVVLGPHPQTGRDIALKSGRFGPYVEMDGAQDEKPKRASVPRGWRPEEMTLAKAVSLIDLPREVGPHPETKEPIQAGLGRYGPYLLHQGKYTKLESVEEIFDIGLNRAVTLIAERKEGKSFARTPTALRSLGEHPTAGGEITVREGRYGPYVNHGKVNATLPKGTDPQALTQEEALKLLDAKAAKGGGKPAKGKGTPTKGAAKPKASKSAAPKGKSTASTATSRANGAARSDGQTARAGKGTASGAAKASAGAKTGGKAGTGAGIKAGTDAAKGGGTRGRSAREG